MDPFRRDLLKLAALATFTGCAPSPAVPSSSQIDRSRRMRTRPLMTLRLSVAPTQNIGVGPYGAGVTFPIVGGSFEGERLRGRVLAGGDDWTTRRADGVVDLDLRITLQTEDEALIYMTFEGLHDDGAPGGSYFRTLPRFETAAPRYAYLNKLLAVGVGETRSEGPVHTIEEIL
jgi:hypothetical protein